MNYVRLCIYSYSSTSDCAFQLVTAAMQGRNPIPTHVTIARACAAVGRMLRVAHATHARITTGTYCNPMQKGAKVNTIILMVVLFR